MANAPVIKGSSAMTMVSTTTQWTPQRGKVYTEIWEGPYAVAETFADAKEESKEWDDVGRSGKPVRQITLSRDEDSTGGSGSAVDTAETWSVRGIQIIKDLRCHPHFNSDSPGAGKSMAAEMVKIDNAIRRGVDYKVVEPNYPANMKRYQGLRMNGVDSYPALQIEIKKRINVAARESVKAAAWDMVFQVIPFKDIGATASVIGQVNDIQRLLRDGPNPATLGKYEKQKWEWLQDVPEVTPEKGGKRYDIVQTWIGAERYSWVLYSSNKEGTPATEPRTDGYGGTWNPLGD